MNKLLLLGFTLAVVAPLAQAGAGHDHSHGHSHEAAVEAAPHGGVLRDALPFKVELVLNGDQARMYVYDRQLKPVTLDKPEIKGRLKYPRQSKTIVVTLKRSAAGDAYEATMTGIAKVHRYDLHIDLEVGDQKVLADFGVDNIH